MKIIILTLLMVVALANLPACTFTAGPASGGLKYKSVKQTPSPKQVPAERQTHRKFGKNPKNRPHDN